MEKSSVPVDTMHVYNLGHYVKGSKGNPYLIVAVDAFAKFLFAKSVKTKKKLSQS